MIDYPVIDDTVEITSIIGRQDIGNWLSKPANLKEKLIRNSANESTQEQSASFFYIGLYLGVLLIQTADPQWYPWSGRYGAYNLSLFVHKLETPFYWKSNDSDPIDPLIPDSIDFIVKTSSGLA